MLFPIFHYYESFTMNMLIHGKWLLPRYFLGIIPRNETTGFKHMFIFKNLECVLSSCFQEGTNLHSCQDRPLQILNTIILKIFANRMENSAYV